jgi:hypothetical protein
MQSLSSASILGGLPGDIACDFDDFLNRTTLRNQSLHFVTGGEVNALGQFLDM